MSGGEWAGASPEAIATLVGDDGIFLFSMFLASRPELVIRSWFSMLLSECPNLAWSVSLLDECDSEHDTVPEYYSSLPVLSLCRSLVTLKGTTPRITFKQFLSLPCAIDTLLIDLQSIMNCSTDGMRLRGNLLDRIQKGSTSLGVPIPSNSTIISSSSTGADGNWVKATHSLPDSDPDHFDKRYIVICFPVVLQTQTSLGPSYRTQIARQLSDWDTVDDHLLYDVLQIWKRSYNM
ncbi:hypothetical protein BJ165DRAFT_1529335 [Panaeolus papilionaceus]|nr:hypothetical protein BJ165DRAFT_1529335 [Panaeolus papilionaceus]